MAKKAAKKASKRQLRQSGSTAKTKAAKKSRSVTKRATARQPPRASRVTDVAVASEPIAHMLDALLHTMRSIAQHEDELCTLLHDVKQRKTVGAGLRRDLQQRLLELPAEDYLDDLHALQAAFVERKRLVI